MMSCQLSENAEYCKEKRKEGDKAKRGTYSPALNMPRLFTAIGNS